jgi:hypothetical protein
MCISTSIGEAHFFGLCVYVCVRARARVDKVVLILLSLCV